MRVVCAWCKRSMGTKMGPDDLVTHGICADCAAEIDRKVPVCETHGHYLPTSSRFDGHPVCPKCERESFPEWYDDSDDGDGRKETDAEDAQARAEMYYGETLAEVNARRGYDK
jgi:hypothetical protein